MQFLLGTEDGDEEHIPHALFTELDEICLREGEDAEWKETARYCTSHMGWVWVSVTLVCLMVLNFRLNDKRTVENRNFPLGYEIVIFCF